MNNKVFLQWLNNYSYDYIDSKTANRCIKLLHSRTSQDNKENALDFLSYYENWNVNQLKRLFDAYPKLNEYNQECLVDTQLAIYSEDLSPACFKQCMKNEWKLLSNSKYNDAAEWAADDMVDYVHPFNLNKAIANYNNNTNRWQRYFAREYLDYWDLDYKRVKRWGKEAKANWVLENAAWGASPRWCLGDRPIYVYIFTVSNYPDRWGDIDLPGCAKDSITYQKMFKGIAKSIEVYADKDATNANYFKAIASIADKERNAIHIFCNSHHGSWDESGHHCQLLYDFDYSRENKIFINTPTSARIHYEVDVSCNKSANILPIFIADYCGSGGVATERAASLTNGYKIKSFHPDGWVPDTVPSSYFEGIKRQSRELWLCGCRPEYFTYDTPDGGAFTLALDENFSADKNFIKIMKQTGKTLLKNKIPSVPWYVSSAGRQKFKLGKSK